MRRLRSDKADIIQRSRLTGGPDAGRATRLEVDAELDFAHARVELVKLNHPGPSRYAFRQEDVFWVDLCLTPRRPKALACYVDHWGPHRFAETGPIMALPPRQLLHLKNAGGRHASLICQLQSDEVFRRLPKNFEWTDRRLGACLCIVNANIRTLLVRMAEELRYPKIASKDLCEAIVAQLSIELARYLLAIGEPMDKGGLAFWRLRAIDSRLAKPGKTPTLEELAELCRISIRQLTRGFRTSRGCSIGNYVAQSRIEAAKRRLATDESIKSIAYSLGFSSQSNFTSAFRRATGNTPSDFRTKCSGT